jgi:hypothetical protein
LIAALVTIAACTGVFYYLQSRPPDFDEITVRTGLPLTGEAQVVRWSRRTSGPLFSNEVLLVEFRLSEADAIVLGRCSVDGYSSGVPLDARRFLGFDNQPSDLKSVCVKDVVDDAGEHFFGVFGSYLVYRRVLH